MGKLETLTLNNGKTIPVVGYGTWLIKEEIAEDCVYNALKVGYRHIDSAQAYGNECGVGRGIRKSGLNRKEVYVTSKVQAEIKEYQKAKESIEESLKRLDIGYIDLMLIHCPMPWNEYSYEGGYRYEKENREVYKALEEAYEEGKIASIGVSNFNIDDLKNILNNCKVKPVVNQIPVHIGYTNMELINFCHENGILIESYSPIAHGRILENEGIKKVADKYHVSVAQLCIKYTVQLGTITLPKATSLEHMKDNLELDFVISDEDMDYLKAFKL